MTVWPYLLVTGAMRSAPKASPYITRVLTTLAMVSPFSPLSRACCSGVRINAITPYFVNIFLFFPPERRVFHLK